MTDSRWQTEELPDDVHAFDAAVQDAFDAVSQRLSRRGLLAKLGRLTLAMLGAQIVYEVLPLCREAAKAGEVSCSSWYMCGFCGYQCGCTGCSGELSKCPKCACVGGSWTACCCTTSGCNRYKYQDCFSQGDETNGPCSQTKINNCNSCKYCCNETGVGLYWGSRCSGSYMCTRVVFVESC